MARILVVNENDEDYVSLIHGLCSIPGKDLRIFRARNVDEVFADSADEVFHVFLIALEELLRGDESQVQRLKSHFKGAKVVALASKKDSNNIPEVDIDGIVFRELVTTQQLVEYFDFADKEQRTNKQKEPEIERAKRYYQAQLANMHELTRSIAHEIYNPLTVIKGSLLSVKARDTDAKFERAIKRSIDATDRITKIVESMREYTSTEVRADNPETNIEQAIKWTSALCSQRVAASGIRFQLPEQTPQLEVAIEQRHLMQILINLIQNSKEAIIRSETPWIRLEVEALENSVKFSVVDSGTGIESDVIDKILIPFFTTKSSQFSIGLGLNASSELVSSYGGELWYDSSAENTTFSFTLPLVQSQKAAA